MLHYLISSVPVILFCFAVACIFVNIYAPGCAKGHPPNLRSPFSSLTGSLRYMALKEKIMVNPSIQLSKFLLYTITSQLFCQVFSSSANLTVFSSSADLIAAHFPDIILSKHLHYPINCSQYPAGDNTVQDHRPAMVNILQPTPKTSPSALNSSAHAATELAKPVIGTR